MNFLQLLSISCSALISSFFFLGLASPLPAQSDGGEVPTGLESSDWDSIRAAYDSGRHQAFATEDGFHAHNPRQAWLTKFDGKGFLVQPDSGEWTWGLQFVSYGFEGAMQDVPLSGVSKAAGNRIAYDWDVNVQEWYVNDTQGLEHGFTLKSRPEKGGVESGALTFHLHVRGSLQAEVYDSGDGIRFVDGDGTGTLTYAGLHVFDADGKVLPSTFTGAGDSIQISIDETGARYPITVDPVAQQAYLKASNTDGGDHFGISVAISGDVVVVGAYNEDSASSGVDGDQSDNSAGQSGAAYVFRRTGGNWAQEAYLKASNPDANDLFGHSVAVSGNLIIVGAYWESSSASGVNGNQTDNSSLLAGAAYVFAFNGASWVQEAYLKASNNIYGSTRFGYSVGVSGNLAVVGAYQEPSNATGVNGNQNDTSLNFAGAAYVFERNGGNWIQQAYLKASNTDQGDQFGFDVAISGRTILVGARHEWSNSSGVGGNQGNDSNTQKSGAVYVFKQNSGNWSQEAYLKASNTGLGDYFGSSVAISGNIAVVGAPSERSESTGVNSEQFNNNAFGAGSAYVFDRVGNSWSQQAYLKASNTEAGAQFGEAVAIFGTRIAVGASLDDSPSAGVNGDQSDSGSSDSGAVYYFERHNGVWSQEAFLKASNAQPGEHFGVSVAMSRDFIVVGSPSESSNATGVNGDQGNNTAGASGAAYVFDLASPTANYCGPAVPNSSGFPGSISMTGSLAVAANDITLHATQLPINQFGFFLNSPGHFFLANPGGSLGNLCLGGGAPLGRHNRSHEIGFSGAAGAIDLTLDLLDVPTAGGIVTIQAGETWNFQCWFRDGAAAAGASNFTNGLSVLFE